MRRLVLAVASLALALPLGGGCVPFRRASAPIDVLPVGPARDGSRTLLVLLPGRFDRPADFVRHGFAPLARQAGADVEIVAVDAHVGYYREGSLARRLHEDVIAPARARGVRRVWIAGVSMGAMGALWYAERYPEDVERIVALAPYLGAREAVSEAARSGGLLRWAAPEAPSDYSRRTLAAAQRSARDGRPELWLGFGTEDRFVENARLLARALPASRVVAVRGGHDWRAWRAAWRGLVRAGALR